MTNEKGRAVHATPAQTEREEVRAILERVNTGMATATDAQRLGAIIRRAWDAKRESGR